MNELGIRPEHECFDTGHLANLDPLLDMGIVSRAAADLVRDGRARRDPARARGTSRTCRAGAGAGAPCEWRVIGVSRGQWPLGGGRGSRSAATCASDWKTTSICPNGEMARSNGDLVAAAAQLVKFCRVARWATVDEARELARRPRRCMSGALADIRVLDLSRLLPGGFCSLLLADFGAEVLKVEDTGMGDYIRWAPPYYEGADESARVGACSSR